MRYKGFNVHENEITKFDNRYSAYLNSPNFYNGLVKAYHALEANNLLKAKSILDTLESHDNIKARFIAKPIIQNDNIDEIESLKKRINLAAIPIDLGAEKIICEELKFIFVVTPKAGSRSILDYFRQNENINSKIRLTHAPLQSLLHKHPELNDYFKFTFVRNPYDRVLSCYNDKILTKNFEKNKVGEKIPTNDFIKRNESTYKLNPEMSFNDFVNFLLSEYGGDFIGNRHWLSQYVPVTNNKEELIVDYIGKLENVRDDWAEVCERIKIPYKPLAKKNTTKSKLKGIETISYTPELKNLIALRYKEDFEIFNYLKD